MSGCETDFAPTHVPKPEEDGEYGISAAWGLSDDSVCRLPEHRLIG